MFKSVVQKLTANDIKEGLLRLAQCKELVPGSAVVDSDDVPDIAAPRPGCSPVKIDWAGIRSTDHYFYGARFINSPRKPQVTDAFRALGVNEGDEIVITALGSNTLLVSPLIKRY